MNVFALKRSALGLGRVMNRGVARELQQIKTCLRYGDARFLHALNTNTTSLKISFSWSGSNPNTVALYQYLKKNEM